MTGHLLWTGYGPLTRALTRPPGYLYGVGHRLRPDACPWVEPSDYIQGPLCPPQFEFRHPISEWNQARLSRVYDSYWTTKELVGRWPTW